MLASVEWFHFKKTGGRSLCSGLVLNPSTIKKTNKTMCSRDVYVSEIEGPDSEQDGRGLHGNEGVIKRGFMRPLAVSSMSST